MTWTNADENNTSWENADPEDTTWSTESDEAESWTDEAVTQMAITVFNGDHNFNVDRQGQSGYLFNQNGYSYNEESDVNSNWTVAT